MRLVLLGLTLLAASACGAQDEQTPSDMPSIVMCSGSIKSDSYDLGQLSVDGSDLLVHLATGGGCAPHSFAICWDGQSFDTFPPSVDLALSHDAHGDTCDALLLHDLRIDLTPLLEKQPPPLLLRITGATSQLEGTIDLVHVGD